MTPGVTRIRFVSPLERALYLKTIGTLRELPQGELAALAQRAREQFFRKGTRILTPGQRLESFHIVVEGRVLTRGAEHGESELGSQEALGFLTMLSRWPEGLEATAEVDTTTLEIDADDFYDVLEDHFNLVDMTIRNISRTMLLERREIPEGTYLAPAEGLLDHPEQELDLIERLLFLSRGTALLRTNMDSLIQMAQAMKEIRFRGGDRLWKAGAPSGDIRILVSGTVECTVEKSGTRFRTGPGYPLGNLENLAGEPRWYTAVAETPVVALEGASDLFLDVLEDHFEMTQGFLASIATGLITVLQERRA